MTENRGLETLLEEPPVLKIGGESRQMRRIGIRDLFTFLRLFKGIVTLGTHDLRKLSQLQFGVKGLEALSIIFYLGVPELEEALVKLLGNVVGMTEAEVSDPALFPLGSEIVVLKGLASHPDVTRFLANMQLLMGDPQLQEVVQKIETAERSGNGQSTDSSVDTATQPSKS